MQTIRRIEHELLMEFMLLPWEQALAIAAAADESCPICWRGPIRTVSVYERGLGSSDNQDTIEEEEV